MKLLSTPEDARSFAREMRSGDSTIGFVPTMGALHEGHLALAKRAAAECDAVVVSVFVNPLQFGAGEDFGRYPRDLDQDRRLLSTLPVSAVFAPSPADVYPAGFATGVVQDELSTRLCGAFRPGHFRGVLTVVAKLFSLVRPHVAYFGQKDAQQVLMIRRMALDLGLDVDVRAVETVRDPDGLALSSRNRYLSAEERRQALSLSRGLRAAELLFLSGERRGDALRASIRGEIERERAVRLQYASVVSLDDLRDVDLAPDRALAAVAAVIGTTRLIDNVVLGSRGKPNAGLF